MFNKCLNAFVIALAVVALACVCVGFVSGLVDAIGGVDAVFVAGIIAAQWLFIASPVIIVVVGLATLVSDYRFNKALGR